MIKMGIEHEFTFQNHAVNYLDFENNDTVLYQ